MPLGSIPERQCPAPSCRGIATVSAACLVRQFATKTCDTPFISYCTTRSKQNMAGRRLIPLKTKHGGAPSLQFAAPPAHPPPATCRQGGGGLHSPFSSRAQAACVTAMLAIHTITCCAFERYIYIWELGDRPEMRSALRIGFINDAVCRCFAHVFPSGMHFSKKSGMPSPLLYPGLFMPRYPFGYPLILGPEKLRKKKGFWTVGDHV